MPQIDSVVLKESRTRQVRGKMTAERNQIVWWVPINRTGPHHSPAALGATFSYISRSETCQHATLENEIFYLPRATLC